MHTAAAYPEVAFPAGEAFPEEAPGYIPEEELPAEEAFPEAAFPAEEAFPSEVPGYIPEVQVQVQASVQV